MRRTLVVLLALLAIATLSGFTILPIATQLPTQTSRLRWTTTWLGSTAPTRNSILAGTFSSDRDPGGVVGYGPSEWRIGGIECTSRTAGSTDGGSNALTMRILHEDGGEDCACSFGTSSCQSTSEMICACNVGFTLNQMGGTFYSMEIGADAGCFTYPTNITCSADLFR